MEPNDESYSKIIREHKYKDKDNDNDNDNEKDTDKVSVSDSGGNQNYFCQFKVATKTFFCQTKVTNKLFLSIKGGNQTIFANFKWLLNYFCQLRTWSIFLTATAAMAGGTQLFEGAHLTGGDCESSKFWERNHQICPVNHFRIVRLV